MRRADRIAKRALDILVSAGALAATAPALAALAVLVRVDSNGPALFRQKRLGRGGRAFDILKLRTMRVDAGVRLQGESVVNSADDERHTRVGRVLRRYSLDELPQLMNVLMGNMSLVGPRPDLPEALSFYTDDERAKLDVKPGLTGLAQVSGRNALSPRERWAFDAEYARSATFAGDLGILLKTMLVALRGDGVYKKGSE